jgi:hypothetical protein
MKQHHIAVTSSSMAPFLTDFLPLPFVGLSFAFIAFLLALLLLPF